MATIQKRARKNGSPTYTATIRIKGQPSLTKTFDRQADAKTWVREHEAEVRTGKHTKRLELERLTVGTLIDRYITDVLEPAEKPSAATTKQQLGWWKEEIGTMPVSQLTSAVIVEARTRLLKTPTPAGKKRSPSTGNRYTVALAAVLSIATREWLVLDANPMERVKKLVEPPGRVRFLSDDERRALLKACGPQLRVFTLLLIFSGMRRDEARNLTWRQVDLEAGTARIEKSKNRSARTVPLAPVVVTALREHAKVRQLSTKQLVFPSTTDPNVPRVVNKSFRKAVERAGIQDFHIHDCRHTAASYLAQTGSSLLEIGQILGHKTIAMVKRYSHLTDSVTTVAINRMAARFAD